MGKKYQERGFEKYGNWEGGKNLKLCPFAALSYFVSTRNCIYSAAADTSSNIASYNLKKANIAEIYTANSAFILRDAFQTNNTSAKY